MSVMYSKVRIAGHPLHPMLIAFPVTFYTATLLSYLAYAATADLFWWRMGLWSNITGVLTALLAAIPGFIDWARGIPKHTRAKATGRIHMLINLAALIVFTINLFVQADKWVEMAATARVTGLLEAPNPVVAIVLSALGVALTAAGGYLGYTLVQTHHVGVELNEEQQLLERSHMEPHHASTEPGPGRPLG